MNTMVTQEKGVTLWLHFSLALMVNCAVVDQESVEQEKYEGKSKSNNRQ